MTVYVAICDDNIADRKQTERLLEREKDARLASKTDVLYIESFGSVEALMRTPVKYDIFFIDMTQGSQNGMDIAKTLRKIGIIAPIVLFSSSIDYSLYSNPPGDLSIINKPISAGQISHYIDYASEWTKNKIPLIEIRCKSETHFVKYTNLVKATPIAQFRTQVTLADGSILDMMDSINALFNTCASYNCFIACGKELVNVRHIKHSTAKGFILSNGEAVHYYFYQRKKILQKIGDSIPTAIS